jgi:hypothetical protein
MEPAAAPADLDPDTSAKEKGFHRGTLSPEDAPDVDQGESDEDQDAPDGPDAVADAPPTA